MAIRIDTSSLEQLKNDADINQSQPFPLDPETVTAGIQSLLSTLKFTRQSKCFQRSNLPWRKPVYQVTKSPPTSNGGRLIFVHKMRNLAKIWKENGTHIFKSY